MLSVTSELCQNIYCEKINIKLQLRKSKCCCKTIDKALCNNAYEWCCYTVDMANEKYMTVLLCDCKMDVGVLQIIVIVSVCSWSFSICSLFLHFFVVVVCLFVARNVQT